MKKFWKIPKMFQLNNTKNLLRTTHVLLILTVCILSVTLAGKNTKNTASKTQNPLKRDPLKSIQNPAIQKASQKGVGNRYATHLVKTPKSHPLEFSPGDQRFKIIVDKKPGYKGADAGQIRERTRTFSYKDTANFAQTHNNGRRPLTVKERDAARDSIKGWRANGQKTDGVGLTMYKGTKEGIRLDYQRNQGLAQTGETKGYANYQLQFNKDDKSSKRIKDKLPTSLAQVNLPIGMAQKYPKTVGTGLSRSVDNDKIVQIAQTKQVLPPPANDKRWHA